MANKTISYTEARKNLSYILKDSYLNDNTYVVTQHDIPVVVIQKFEKELISNTKTREKDAKKLKALMGLYGLMKGEIDDPIKYAEKIRKEGWRGK